jgi:hypothetical protein
MTLISALIEKQQTENLTERAFAAKLGIEGGSWNMLKHGKRRIGRKTLKGILRAYPDLHTLAIEYHTESIDEPVAAVG